MHSLRFEQSLGVASRHISVESASIDDHLLRRREATKGQWQCFRKGLKLNGPQVPGDDILASWHRSADAITTYQLHAPVDSVGLGEASLQGSALGEALAVTGDAIRQLVEEGDLVVALADTSGRLVWTCASENMREAAEKIRFTQGSHWHEEVVGTHAIGISLQTRRPATVFSCEHYQPFAHDWVSYGAPVCYPGSGEAAGVFCISTLWHRHTPLGQAAVTELARSLGLALPEAKPRAELEIHALGQPRVIFRGKQLQLPQRQIEILCLLALNARGLSLDAFHAALYGDAPVSSATLKAELSRLRHLLDGCIGSRPYRLQIPVWADFIEIWQLLRRKQSEHALSLYRGSLLPASASPELEEWRHCIDAVMGQALDSCSDPVMLMKKLCEGAAGSELVRERLHELMAG